MRLTIETLGFVILAGLLIWRVNQVLRRTLRLWIATRDGAKIQWPRPSTATRTSEHSKARLFRRYR